MTRRPSWTRYLPGLCLERRREALRDDLCGHLTEAFDAERAGCGRGEIEHAATHERATVVDGDDDALAAMGHAQLGAERQRTMGAGHGVLIEALTGGRLAARLVAVERGNAGEAVSGAGMHHRVGVLPGLLGSALRALVRILAGVVGVMIAVMPGAGRSLSGACTDQESCGDERERRVRAGKGSRRRLLGIQHLLVPQRSIATYVTSGTPVPFRRVGRFASQYGEKLSVEAGCLWLVQFFSRPL